jgi:hypothetical protein
MPYVLVDPLNIFEQQELMSALQLVTQAAQPVQLGWIRGLHFLDVEMLWPQDAKLWQQFETDWSEVHLFCNA